MQHFLLSQISTTSTDNDEGNVNLPSYCFLILFIYDWESYTQY